LGKGCCHLALKERVRILDLSVSTCYRGARALVLYVLVIIDCLPLCDAIDFSIASLFSNGRPASNSLSMVNNCDRQTDRPCYSNICHNSRCQRTKSPLSPATESSPAETSLWHFKVFQGVETIYTVGQSPLSNAKVCSQSKCRKKRAHLMPNDFQPKLTTMNMLYQSSANITLRPLDGCLQVRVVVDGARCRHKNRTGTAADRCAHWSPQVEPTAAGTVWYQQGCYACLLLGSNRTASASPCWSHAASWIPTKPHTATEKFLYDTSAQNKPSHSAINGWKQLKTFNLCIKKPATSNTQ